MIYVLVAFPGGSSRYTCTLASDLITVRSFRASHVTVAQLTAFTDRQANKRPLNYCKFAAGECTLVDITNLPPGGTKKWTYFSEFHGPIHCRLSHCTNIWEFSLTYNITTGSGKLVLKLISIILVIDTTVKYLALKINSLLTTHTYGTQQFWNANIIIVFY